MPASFVNLKQDPCEFNVERVVAEDGDRGKLRLRAGSAGEALVWASSFERAIARVKGEDVPAVVVADEEEAQSPRTVRFQ